MLSILGLVQMDRNWISWLSALKILYIHLLVLQIGEELQIKAHETGVQKKSMPNSNYEKNSMPGQGM